MNVNQLAGQQTYRPDAAAIFFKSRERYGLVSNMTGGMPLLVNQLHFQSSEGLYQALKFPQHPDIQERIGSINSGLFAKNVAYSKEYRPHFNKSWWNGDARIDATIAILAIKLQQHPEKFGNALRETGDLPIVKRTPTDDDFWGAILQPDGTVVGGNALGKLLTQLRDALIELDDPQEAATEFAGLIAQPSALYVNRRPLQI